jgi:hypothetical protein
LLLLLPNFGKRKPVCRSRRMAAAKNGKNGMSGTFFTQNDALVPHTKSSRSAVAVPKRNDHGGDSSSHVVKLPRRTRYTLSPSRSIDSPVMR